MGWILYRIRGVQRRGRGVALAVVVAVVGTALLTAMAGARRTATAVDRLAAEAGEFDVFVDGSGTDPEQWPAVADLPSVDGALEAAFVYAFPDDEGYHPLLARVDPPGGPGDALATGHLVDGRRPDAEAADEVALSEHTAEALGLEVGDVLSLASFSPAATEALEQSEAELEPDGPPIDLEVVGIVRSTQDVLARPGDPTVTMLPHGFFERYRGEVAMVEGSFLVRLVDRPGARRAFGRELRETFAGGPSPAVEGLGSTEALDESMTVLVTALLAFALVVYLAGAAAIGQATSRSAADREPEQLALAGLGLGRSGRWLDAWVPMVLAGVVGVGGAVVVAVSLSPLFPVGLARRVDPDLGLTLDPLTLLAGIMLVLVTVGALGAWSAWRTSRAPVGGGAGSRTTFGRWSGGLVGSAPPAAHVGVGLATNPGRGASGIPIRTAFSGVLLAVMGLVASLVFGASMVRLLDTPARYGWSWDASLATRGDQPQALADRPDTTAVADGVFNATAEVEGATLFAFALDPVEGDLGPAMADGRMPRGDQEVALGADTQQRLGHPTTVEAVDRDGAAHQFGVVGTVVIPSIDDPVPMADGAYFSMEGLARLGLDRPGEGDSSFRQTVVQFIDGTDVGREIEALDIDDDPSFPEVPQEVERLEQVSRLPGVLAAFLAALGLLAAGQALWQTVRRRRREIAVLRTLGFDRGQVTRTFGWQAASIAAAGTALGVPAGLVLGRALWSEVAGNLGVAADVTVPASVLAVIAAALSLPVVLGLGFGHRAGRRVAAVDLRAE